jgi:hypothetical protein
MASNMGFFDRLRGSSTTRLLNDLANLVGSNEELAARLARHGSMATANLKGGIEALAEQEAAHVKKLKVVLSSRNMWPRPPEPPARDGINNWERLGADLALLGALASGFHRASAQWEGVDPAVADELEAIAIADDDHESELRKLALKCDPQALD